MTTGTNKSTANTSGGGGTDGPFGFLSTNESIGNQPQIRGNQDGWKLYE